MSNLAIRRLSPDPSRYDLDRPRRARNPGLTGVLVAMAVLAAVVVLAIKANPVKLEPTPAAQAQPAGTPSRSATPASTGSTQQVTGAIIAAL